MIPYMRLLLSNFCIYVFMLLFSFSIFSDRPLKIEYENNNRKTLIAKSSYMGLGSPEFWPRGYKTFFVLNSIEHEILSAHKYKNIKKLGFF